MNTPDPSYLGLGTTSDPRSLTLTAMLMSDPGAARPKHGSGMVAKLRHRGLT
jgi:hypothetical protein